MVRYLVVVCAKCGSYRVVSGVQKTFRCFSCGTVSGLRQELVVAYANTAEEARQKIAHLKISRAARREESKP
jgi:DNA-directed RNA polymerase subunit N (RpoN/RPB10)